MKLEKIQTEIISNYEALNKKAQIKSDNPDILPAWALTLKNKKSDVFISQTGQYEGKNTIVRINSYGLDLIKKPLFYTWKKTLKNINKMILNATENFDNPKLVQKNQINFMLFPKKALGKLVEVGKKIK